MSNQKLIKILTAVGIGVNAILLFPQASSAINTFPAKIADKQRDGDIPNRTWQIADAIETAKIYYKRAQVKANAKDYEGAIADYSEVIQLVPDYDKPYVNRGNLRDALGDKTGALEDYGQALSINPQNHLAYYNRAVTLEGMKKHSEAISDYSQTIRLKPDFVSAYKNRGLNNLAIQNLRNAVQDFQRAAQLYQEAGNQQGYQQMQQILKALGQS